MSKLNLFKRIDELEEEVIGLRESLMHLTQLMDSGEEYMRLRADYIEDCVNLMAEGLELNIDLEHRTVTKKRKNGK